MSSAESIWHEYGPTLKGFIRRRVSDQAQAEDILQDVVLKIHAGLDKLRDETKVRAWIFRICRNTIIDHYRRKRLAAAPVDDLYQESGIVEEQFRQDLVTCLREMIQALPERDRQAVVMTAYEGLTQREMSERLGISLSGAKSRVQRARGRLKADLLNCCRVDLDVFGRVIDYRPREPRQPGSGGS